MRCRIVRIILENTLKSLDCRIRVAHGNLGVHHFSQSKHRVRFTFERLFIGSHCLWILFLLFIKPALPKGTHTGFRGGLFQLSQHHFQLFRIPLLGKNLCLGPQDGDICRFKLKCRIDLLHGTIQVPACCQELRQT